MITFELYLLTQFQKGIATMFKSKFGRVDELKQQHASVGGMAVLYTQNPDRFIYYLVTKPFYYTKPTYQTLESSLNLMRDHMITHSVTRLSMPLIGCGLDKLEWDNVRTLIEKVFDGCNVHITVYRLPASDQPPKNNRRGGRGGRGRGGRGSNRGGNHSHRGKN
jgi:hypothetical protein